MATEPVSKPASLPTYPEMIMGAIDALKEKDGSSKSAIGKHIESTYGDLPAGHMNSLTEHLNKLREDGELVFAKNNYMRPGSSAPPKRGRGRPPKVKDANAAEVPVVAAATPPAAPAAAATAVADGPSRGRGRPRKDPNAPPSVKKAKTEKPKEDEKEEDPTPSKSGRARGRPRKVQPALGQNGVEAN
ncbi:HMG-Y-related protein A-like [Apium graveolens]|uniref:HMG-Y-related protein A-like n=1 Tax=Apium graveolens TaxID=4045 RepID=UPI003D7AB95C